MQWYNSNYLKKSSYLCRRKNKVRTNIMALEIAAVPVLTGEASDRFDQMMEQSEQRRGSVDFSREINEARAILSKANF
jgi:hypothetical protein